MNEACKLLHQSVKKKNHLCTCTLEIADGHCIIQRIYLESTTARFIISKAMFITVFCLSFGCFRRIACISSVLLFCFASFILTLFDLRGLQVSRVSFTSTHCCFADSFFVAYQCDKHCEFFSENVIARHDHTVCACDLFVRLLKCFSFTRIFNKKKE